MEKITVSSKGQIAIPKEVREALNLTAGSKLTLEVRGQEIVLSKGDAWKQLKGAARDLDIDWAAFKKAERELEDSRS
ncbi:MAG TPA: AbrB/MazE/SpoVT family DNA-binding domain-containing protein [Candidatus Eisenbacteria bacterium]|nr:AbrB/MazE/SpoVT family DNA-binding domain-containing protein [Candidatus Eisenbacteria bacterium]